MKNKIDRPKVFIDLVKDNYVLTRLEDNKQITASVIKFVEWNEDGTKEGKAVCEYYWDVSNLKNNKQ